MQPALCQARPRSAARKGEDVNQPRKLILAIAANDKALHVGPAADLGAHFVGLKPGGHPFPGPGSAQHAGVGQLAAPERPRTGLWDFFDNTGHVLTRGEVENPESLAPPNPAEVVDEQAVLMRVARVLGYFQALLDADPAVGEIAPGVFVTEVPHPLGTLAAVMEMLAPGFGILNPHQMGNRGGWLHMLAHKAGVAH